MNRAGRSAWTDGAFRQRIEDWARARLANSGQRIVGPVEQPHVRPWSTVLRIPTDRGPVWAKALGPGTAHEAPLLAALVAWGTPGIVPPLAVDEERGWVLSPDGGPTLRQTRPDGTGDHDLDAWQRIVREHAALQRSTERRVDDLLAIGVPDGRPATLATTLRALLDDDALWDPDLQEPDDRAAVAAARPRLQALVPWVEASADDLGGSGIAATIQHDDLHGGNIFVGPAGVRYFDWGDAVVAHPFGTMTVTLNSIAHHAGLEPSHPGLAQVRAAYLEAWTDVASRADLDRLLSVALDLGRIARAAAWLRALEGVPLDEREGHGGAPAAWLADLVERRDRRPE